MLRAMFLSVACRTLHVDHILVSQPPERDWMKQQLEKMGRLNLLVDVPCTVPPVAGATPAAMDHSSHAGMNHAGMPGMGASTFQPSAASGKIQASSGACRSGSSLLASLSAGLLIVSLAGHSGRWPWVR